MQMGPFWLDIYQNHPKRPFGKQLMLTLMGICVICLLLYQLILLTKGGQSGQ